MAIENLQEYLVERGRKSLSDGDPWMAKSWLLTCGAIYSSSFDVQFTRYQMAKNEKNVADASRFLVQMMNQNQNQRSELKHEKKKMVDVVKSGLGSSSSNVQNDDQFYGQLFDTLSNDHKYQVLMSVASDERSSNSASNESITKLMLLTLKMFPAKITEDGLRLLSIVSSSEKESKDEESRSFFRKILLFDVLPLILSPESDIKIKFEDIESHLITLLENFISNIILNSSSSISKVEVKVFEIFSMLASKFYWQNQLFEYFSNFESTELILNRISNLCSSSSSKLGSQNIKIEPSDGPIDLTARAPKIEPIRIELDTETIREVTFGLILSLIRCLQKYIRESINLVLLENYNKVSSSPVASSSSQSKKRKVHQSLIPELVCNNPKLVSSFLICIKTLDIVSSLGPQVEESFDTLVKKIGLATTKEFQEFKHDVNLYAGKNDELIMSISNPVITPSPSLKSLLQVMSSSLIIYDYPSAIHHSFLALEKLREQKSSNNVQNSEFDNSRTSSSRTKQPSVDTPTSSSLSRSLFFLELEHDLILSFAIDVIIMALKSLVFMSIKPSDAGIGDLIVLSQFQWPKYVDVFVQCINLIKKPLLEHSTTSSNLSSRTSAASASSNLNKFTYHPFLDYVFIPDHLEEFMSLANEEKLLLELKVPSTSSSSNPAKSMTTRGTNKGVKEEVKSCLMSQMKKSVTNIDHELILDFTINHMSKVLKGDKK